MITNIDQIMNGTFLLLLDKANGGEEGWNAYTMHERGYSASHEPDDGEEYSVEGTIIYLTLFRI